MRDKAGQVYSTIGGLVAGAGAGALLSGATNAFAGWIAPIGSGAVGATALGLYMILAALLDWWLPGRKTSLAVVIADAKALSTEIFEWIAERDMDHRALIFEPIGQPHDTEGHRRRNDRMMRQSDQTMANWKARFAVRVLFSYKQLLSHGADDLSEGGRFPFENAVNTIGIEDAARTLGLMAARLEAKKMSRH